MMFSTPQNPAPPSVQSQSFSAPLVTKFNSINNKLSIGGSIGQKN